MFRIFILSMIIFAFTPVLCMSYVSVYPGFGVGFLKWGDGPTDLQTTGFVGFRVHPMVGIVMEGNYSFESAYGYTIHVVQAGGGMDIFVIGFMSKKPLVDPYFYARGGYTRGFGVPGAGNGGYARFGGGIPFLLGTIMPYVEFGGFIAFGGGGSSTAFNLMGGLRFDL